MARSSVVAARMLANEERNRQLFRGGAAPQLRQALVPQRVRHVAAGHSLAATDCRALAGAGCFTGVRNGVRRTVSH